MSELPRSTAQESTCFLFVNCSTGIDTRICMRILHSMNVYVYRAFLFHSVAWGARPGSLIRPPDGLGSCLARQRWPGLEPNGPINSITISRVGYRGSATRLGPAQAGSLG